MASDQKFVDFVLEQIKNAGEITAKKKFGENRIYADDKSFGLCWLCNERFGVKLGMQSLSCLRGNKQQYTTPMDYLYSCC